MNIRDYFFTEAFNTKISLKSIKDSFGDFERHFSVDKIKYEFFAKKITESEGAILFNRINSEGNPTFDDLDSNSYRGDVASGIIKCMTVLLEKHKIKTFAFGSEINKNLNKFYDSSYVIKLIKKKFNFELVDTKIMDGTKYGYYKKIKYSPMM